MTEQPERVPRPRGRPRAEAANTVSVWLSARVHDQLIARAKAYEQSVSKTIRDLLLKKL
jgi:hypothetical protein